MYFGSQLVAKEQRGNEKKMWLAARPIVNLQTLLFFLLHTVYSIQLQQHNRISSQQNLWPKRLESLSSIEDSREI